MSDGIRIETYGGARGEVRWLFEIAEDLAANLDRYIDDGDVLVAVLADRFVGLLQLTATKVPDVLEINVLAVADDQQRRGIGRRLVEAGSSEARRRGCRRLVVATGAADIGNLRFYQRCGFRMLRVERDAFTPATGYPEPIVVDGVRLWDRVWFDLELTTPPITVT